MNTPFFFRSLTQALSWNAFFYVIYKIFSVILTFILYQKLPTDYFSQWVIATNSIFLLLLWLNCGLKKSIPRFCPLFTQDPVFYKKFVHYLLIIKSVILLSGIYFLSLVLHFFAPDFFCTPLLFALFVTEGICALFLLLYHAHFYQKEFNLIQAFFLCLEMIINFTYIFYFSSSFKSIMICLFLSKTIANIGIIIVSFCKLSLIYKKTFTHTLTEQKIESTTLYFFLKHSLIMWLTTILQSFSERNFLLPFILSIEGTIVANGFKVLHDSALFFQRIPLKIIGITDTSLLSYVELSDNRFKELQKAFSILFKLIFMLSAPLVFLGIVLFLKTKSFIATETLILFFVITISSAFELILSPYARILEVKLQHKKILLSYLPYIVGFGLLLFFYRNHFINLLTFITIMHLLRLVSMLCMTFIAKKAYLITIPKLFSWIVFLVSLFITFFIGLYFL